ncbi:uncharacterized protein FFNC_15336 [Fusarium fujikuroi]|nr:uncharacterized protein FFNC_15336 [Fusarium fujikuroi]
MTSVYDNVSILWLIPHQSVESLR